MDNSAHLPLDVRARAFWVGLATLLLLVGIYTALVIGSWARTPLGQRPQGEAAAWLASAESLYQGTMPREPFFRAPAYVTGLALLREVGVPAAALALAARVVNACAHLLSTALIVGLGWKFWRRKGALCAGALWGFYPPAVFLAAQPGPDTLALLMWLIGVALALGSVWQSPIWSGGRLSHRHVWAYPALAGLVFVLAATLSATYWPVALAWPMVSIFLGREARGSRVVAAIAGAGLMAGTLIVIQNIWGGSPQPLAGADLYRLAQAQDTSQPWAASVPAVAFSTDQAASDMLEQEAVFSYEIQINAPPASLAVLNGYWWRKAVRFITFSPARSAWRVLGKAWQFFGVVESSAGPDYARAKNDNLYLMINPLGWAVFLALGLAGMALGWRSPGVHLTLGLAVLALAGGLVWYPSLESRAPVAALLALLSGGMVAQFRPFTPRRKIRVFGVVAAAAVLAWLPRPNVPAVQMAARDCRERALASAALGDYDGAIRELAQANNAKSLLPSDRELITGWRFSILLKNLPASPAASDLEQQLLDNADLAAQSPAAQFRSGVCLWLLGRYEGAIYFWNDLANSNSTWGAAARAALANSGRETPAQAQRRRAWEIGGGPRPDPALAPLFARLHADQPN